MNHPKTLIFIPTYNERENVEQMCADIQQLGLDTDILFLDDNSPDGTGEILDGLARKYHRVRAIHRPSRLGIGSAHSAGIDWAYDNGYELLVTMDCDFTHMPEYLPHLIASCEDCDVVVGSRFIQEKSLKDWNLLRKILTVIGHMLTRSMLGMTYDATGAFRIYRLSRIPRELFQLVRSSSYSFFFESLYILNRNRFRINEIPIMLPARTLGNSKMRPRDVVGSLSMLIDVRLRTLYDTSTYRLRDPSIDRGARSEVDGHEEADSDG